MLRSASLVFSGILEVAGFLYTAQSGDQSTGGG